MPKGSPPSPKMMKQDSSNYDSFLTTASSSDPALGSGSSSSLSFDGARAKPPTIARLEALHQLTLRRAAAVALHFLSNKSPESQHHNYFINPLNNMSLAVTYHRHILEFKTSIMDAELYVLQRVAHMDKTDRIRFCFELLDRDGDGLLNVTELSFVFLVLNGLIDFEPDDDLVRPLAETAIQSLTYDDHDDDDEYVDQKSPSSSPKGSGLNMAQFGQFMERLSTMGMDCNFLEACTLLVHKAMVRETGETILLDALDTMMMMTEDRPHLTVQEQQQAIIQARLILLFSTLHSLERSAVKTSTETVSLQQLVKHLLRYNEVLYTLPYEIYCMLEESAASPTREVDFDAFAHLLLNVISTLPTEKAGLSSTFHVVANGMTLSACSVNNMTQDEWTTIFAGGDVVNVAVEERHMAGPSKFGPRALLIERNGRLDRLFDLFDLNHDGYISLDELVAGLEAFQSRSRISTSWAARAMATTSMVDQAHDVMSVMDYNRDDKLNRAEFASMLEAFANTLHVPLNDLVDFMLVHTALHHTGGDTLSSAEQNGNKVNKRMEKKRQSKKTKSWIKQNSSFNESTGSVDSTKSAHTASGREGGLRRASSAFSAAMSNFRVPKLNVVGAQ